VFTCIYWGTWCSSSRHCAKSRKVQGLIPDGVTGIFHWHKPSNRTTALGLTQPLTDMSTGKISWGGGKGGHCIGLTTLLPSCANCLEIWDPQTPGTLWACNMPVQGLLYFTYMYLPNDMVSYHRSSNAHVQICVTVFLMPISSCNSGFYLVRDPLPKMIWACGFLDRGFFHNLEHHA